LTLILPDIHLPYEDKYAVANVLHMISDVQPERVVQIGDLLDMKAPARWSKGTCRRVLLLSSGRGRGRRQVLANAAERRRTPSWCGSLATTKTACAHM
jgi:hypothetical protein